MIKGRLSCVAILGWLAGFSGCSSGPTSSPPLPGPASSISSLSPSSATAGGAGFTLTINGSNFSSGANVLWINRNNPIFVGGSATMASSSQVTLQISAADIAIPGPVQVAVITPNSAHGSNIVTFVIHASAAGIIQTVSTAANAAPPNGASHDPVVSSNGRFVAFSSEATNLTIPNAKFPEGYLRDTCLGADGCTPSTLLLPAVSGGTAGNPVEGNAQGGAVPSIGNQALPAPSGGIPPEGRFIGFLSSATNLAIPNTTLQQGFVRDTCLGEAAPPGCVPATVLASVTQDGAEPNGAASSFMFANNTCNVAFASAGTNVVSGVTTPNEIYLTSCSANANGPADGFKSSVTLISASTSGVPGDQGGHQPALSSDGRFVAFASTSTNLTSTPTGGVQQIYLRDTCTTAQAGCLPSTTLISLDTAGNPFAGSSQLPAISDDGRFVVFTTHAQQSGGAITSNVSVRDTCNSSTGSAPNCAPSTSTVSIGVNGAVANGSSSSTFHAVSGDGRFVVFSSSATNLVATGNPAAQVFVRDTCNSSNGSVPGCTPTTVLVSVNSTGPIGGFGAAISDDGHFATFQTTVGGVQQILLAATGF